MNSCGFQANIARLAEHVIEKTRNKTNLLNLFSEYDWYSQQTSLYNETRLKLIKKCDNQTEQMNLLELSLQEFIELATGDFEQKLKYLS